MNRRTPAALCTLLVLALHCPPAAAGEPADLPVKILVDRMSPVLRPNEMLTVHGTLTNTGLQTVRRLRVRLKVGDRLTSRSELQQAALAPRLQGSATPYRPLDPEASVELPPGAARQFSVSVPAEQLPFNPVEAEVRPLAVEVRGSGGEQRIGTVTTFVNWWPGRPAPMRLAWVWPLVGTSHRGLGPNFLDDELAESFGPDGRLSDLVGIGAAAAPRTPVTWAVDPELVGAAGRMSRGYTVRPSSRRPGREGSGQEAAARWLAETRSALARAPVLGLPYADPDLAALARTTLTPDVGNAIRIGDDLLAGEIGVTRDARLAWPPGGDLNQSVLDLLTGLRATAIVSAERSLPLTGQLNYTPTAPYRLTGGGGSQALVADGGLAGLLAEGPSAAGPRLAVQRFLAETALIALERPSLARVMVATPPRVWEPDPAYARGLLEFTGDGALPWLTPVTLPAVLATPPDSDVVRAQSYPAPAAAAELSAGHLAAVATARKQLRQFTAILTTSAPVVEDLDDALLRAESAQWRTDPAGGTRLTRAARDELASQFARLRISTAGLVTLTSKSGTIPISIVNDLDQPVRIRVRVESPNLVVGDSAATEQTVAPGRAQITVEARAAKAGVFPITATVLTPDGQALPVSATLRVRSTAYGAVALAITGGALALLVVGSLARVLRRRRRRRGGGRAAPTTRPATESAELPATAGG